MVGVGVGLLVTNQTLAVAVTLTWLLLVEAMVVSFAPGLGRWLPGAAAKLSEVPRPTATSSWGPPRPLRRLRPRLTPPVRFVLRRDIT